MWQWGLFCLSLLILKSMFKGISQCFPAMSICYFGQFNPFHYSPLPFPTTPHYSTAFNIYHYILYLHRCYIFWYCWHSVILFSIPSSPKFHRLVPLLQTCSTYKYV
jgi:hypothetical protein